MDLNTITHVLRPSARAELPAMLPGDAYLAGGTWLFSEPQPELRRLVDLTALAWPPLRIMPNGLHIAATCTLAQLEAFVAPPAWRAAPVIGQSCRALLGSFKIARQATVGGNLCLALPAAPMAALAVALGGLCTVWCDATSQRMLPTAALISGAGKTVLRSGEILRSIILQEPHLQRRAAFRQHSLTPLGRSASLLIGTRAPEMIDITITAATPYPVSVSLAPGASAAQVAACIDEAVPTWLDDVHGAPQWRRRITHLGAAELCEALS